MKQKVLALVVVLMLFSGIAVASSINGDYKGDAVVKVFHDGKELQVEDVPAILRGDRTLIPVYLFKQMGVELTWDLEKYSVDVKLPNEQKQPTTPSVSTKVDVEKIADGLGDLVSNVSYSSNGTVTFDLTFDMNDQSSEKSNQVINSALESGAKSVVINDKTSTITSFSVKDYKDRTEGKISEEEFSQRLHFSSKTTNEYAVSLLKEYSKIADFYKRLGVLGDLISGYSTQLSTTYYAIKGNYDPKGSIDQSYAMLDQMGKSYISYKDQTESIITEAARFNIDLGGTRQLIENSKNSLGYYITAWEYLSRFYYTSAASDFNVYLDNNQKGYDEIMKLRNGSLQYYLDYYGKLQNY